MRRRFLRDDRVLEAGRFERRLPALDAFLDVRHPLRGRRRIDVVDDRLHRLGERGVRILLFQPPARDVAAALRAMLVAAVVDLLDGEVADALVEQSRHHRLLGQLHHAVVHDDAGAAGPRLVRERLRRGDRTLDLDAGRVGVRRFDFDVVRERDSALDERARRVERARPHAGAAAELRHFGREGTRDVDHRRIVLAERLDVERHEDRVVVRRLDRLRDRLPAVRDDVVGDAAQQDAIVASLPFHDAVANRLPALAGAERRPRDLADPEELLAQLRGRDLVVEPVTDAVHGEEALVRLGFFGDDPVVRPDDRRRAQSTERRPKRRLPGVPGIGSGCGAGGVGGWLLRERGDRGEHDDEREESANHAGETRTKDARHVNWPFR